MAGNTRGERLNNPANIRISNNPWQGKIEPSQDEAFEQFDTPEHGIRACAKLLLAYYKDHGLNTIRDIISRWAPNNENDTNSYVSHVSLIVGVASGDTIDLTDPTTLINFVIGIILHENGECIYPRETIAQVCQSVLD